MQTAKPIKNLATFKDLYSLNLINNPDVVTHLAYYNPTNNYHYRITKFQRTEHTYNIMLINLDTGNVEYNSSSFDDRKKRETWKDNVETVLNSYCFVLHQDMTLINDLQIDYSQTPAQANNYISNALSVNQLIN